MITLEQLAERYAYSNAAPENQEAAKKGFMAGFLSCKQLAAEVAEEGISKGEPGYKVYSDIQNIGVDPTKY